MNKKIIIGLTSGLGNQLFQYLLYVHLKEQKLNCSICTVKKHLNEHLGLELTKIFPSTSDEIDKIWKDRAFVALASFFERVLVIIKYKIPALYTLLLKISPYQIVFFPSWKSYTFIDEIADVKELLHFPELDSRNKQIIEAMNSQDSVSIHVRRGDFQKIVKWRLVLGDICDKMYYLRAIECVKKIYSNPRFYVFSDDIAWVKDNLDLPIDSLYVDWNTGQDSYKDLQLMTFCKCNVCANSTFSLIAAWLNHNKDSIKIVPTKWSNKYNDDLNVRYIPKEKSNWVAIDNSTPQVSIIYDGCLGEEEVNWIRKQSYTDYEVISTVKGISALDTRFVGHKSARGNYIYTVEDITSFKNSNHIREWLVSQYLNCKE